MSLPLVALSGEEAVAALRRAGFRARAGEERTILERGDRVVVVPADRILDEDTLRGIMRAAGIDYLRLLENLATPLPIDRV